MRKPSALRTFLVLLALHCTLFAGELGPQQAARLQAIVARHTTAGGPGFAVAVIRAGKLIYKGGFGASNLAKGEQIESDSAFRLASVSKPLTALAVLKLVDDGKLTLEDPVQQHLPSFPYAKVTVENLLHHTSGLPHYKDFPRGFEDRSKRPTNADSLAVLAKFKRRLAFLPGSAFDYSNVGYDMLALVITAASSQPYHRYMEEELFAPLGMSNTFVFSSDRASSIEKRVLGYVYDEDQQTFVVDDEDPLNELVGAGGIYSTLDDMIKLSQALLDGKLLEQETLAAAWTPAQLTGNGKGDYGHGWDVDIGSGDENDLVVGHEGSWVGFDSILELRPGKKNVLIALTNGGVDLNVLLEEIVGALR